jgi:hypothetical protein
MSDDEQLNPELGDEEAFGASLHFDPDDGVGSWDEEHYVDVHIPPVVDDLRPGETIEDRNERLLAQAEQERQWDWPEASPPEPWPDRLIEAFTRREYPTTGLTHGSAVRVIDKDGNETWRDLRKDEEATRTFIEAHGRERGLSLAELQRKFRNGRPTPKERYRRQVLGEIFRAALEAGAKTAMVEKVLGHDRRRLAELRILENPDKTPV